MKQITGTKEWSTRSINIATGCEHGCRYCYARAMAQRFKRLPPGTDWRRPVLRQREVDRGRGRCTGTVMFPSSHDITPALLEPSLVVLRKLLEAGNRVLVVSKPHLACVERLCADLAAHRDRVLYRFTIGAMDDRVLAWWEPGAPTYAERLASLEYAHRAGYATSVSVEPMLEPAHAPDLVRAVQPHVTDSVWLGKMNLGRVRGLLVTPEEREALRELEDGQADARVRTLYAELRDKPLVRWKESIKRVVGLPLATESGLDR